MWQDKTRNKTYEIEHKNGHRIRPCDAQGKEHKMPTKFNDSTSDRTTKVYQCDISTSRELPESVLFHVLNLFSLI